MSAANPIRIPLKYSAAYLAGAYLYQHGPQTEADLFIAVSFGTRKGVRAERLRDAIDAGWLRPVGFDKVACSEAAAQHYGAVPDQDAPAPGEVAAPRSINLMQRPPLSRRHIPNPRGTRSDIPEWSVRVRPHFHTKA